MASGRVLAAAWAPIVEQRYRDRFVDALFRNSWAWNTMKERGKVIPYNDTNIEWIVNTEGNSSVSNIEDGETLPNPGRQAHVNATLNFKILIGIISVGRQVQRHSFGSQSKIKDALAYETRRVIEDMADELHKQIIGTPANAKQMIGIGSAISNTGTYAGIARAGNTFWQSVVNASPGGPGILRPVTDSLLESVIDQLRNSRGAQIDEAWCGNDAWNGVRNLLSASARNNNPDSLVGGAQRIIYEGIPFIKVPGLDTNKIYFLDMRFMEIVISSENDFVAAPESTDSFDHRVSVHHDSQLVVYNPFKFGRVDDVN